MATIKGIPESSLHEERSRYLTFQSYPLTATVPAALLAAKGFVYIGTGQLDDDVMCFYCKKRHRNWQVDDDIDEIHRGLSPVCPMVTGEPCNNVPMVNLFNQPERQADAPMPELLTWRDENDAAVVSENTSEFPSVASLEPTLPEVSPSSSLHQSATATGNIPLLPLSSIPTPESSMTASTSLSAQTNYITNSSQTHPAQQTTQSHPIPQVSHPTPQVSQTHPTPQVSQTYPTPQTSNTASANSQPQSNTDNIDGNSATEQRQSNIEQTHQPTYDDLAIMTERPKRFELAIRSVRHQTYTDENWPRGHQTNIDELCDAGFYYAGYGDCARCFFCGGGLRNWDPTDNVWVEHARWFPRCGYMRLVKGKPFIAAVTKLKEDGRNTILYSDVMQAMGASALHSLEHDPAVLAVMEVGEYEIQEVIDAAEKLIAEGELSAELLLEKLAETYGWKIKDETPIENNLDVIESLRPEVQTLRQDQRCKVCLEREVSVIYLPCGHLVSCSLCAPSCENCPVCRQPVKGVVRASIPVAPQS